MKLKKLEYIFSLKSDFDSNRKIITIFGIKIKIKSKRLVQKLVQRKNAFLASKLEEVLVSNNEMLQTSKKDYSPIRNRLCYCLAVSLPHTTTGYSTRSQYMAKALSKKFDLYVVTGPNYCWNSNDNKGNSVIQEENIEGIKYIRQKASQNVNRFKGLIEAWEKTFLKLKPQYVLAASNNESALPAMVAAKKLSIPFYYEVRGFWELSRAAANPNYEQTLEFEYEKFAEARICNNAKSVFTLTNPMKKELMLRGVDKNKIHLVPNCADLSLFKTIDKNLELLKNINIPQNVPVIGYIGNIRQYEGIDDLMRACAILNSKKIDFRLLIIGGSDERFDYIKYLSNLAKQLKIDNKLVMLEKVKPEKVADYYSLFDISPFGRKPFKVCELVSPIKPLEAMAMQKTVIVSDVEALKDIVTDNETGLYFKKGDVNSYANALEKAVLNPDLRNRLGKNAKAWVEQNRQWFINADTIENVLKSEGR